MILKSSLLAVVADPVFVRVDKDENQVIIFYRLL